MGGIQTIPIYGWFIIIVALEDDIPFDLCFPVTPSINTSAKNQSIHLSTPSKSPRISGKLARNHDLVLHLFIFLGTPKSPMLSDGILRSTRPNSTNNH